MTEILIQGALLGVGLAMDAFSVSLVNGMNEPAMTRRKTAVIPLVFAFFQIIMPLIGWVCVHTVVETFQAVQPAIPWIAFGLLGWIGGKMLWEGFHSREEEEAEAEVKAGGLVMQGIATSIDALSVGFAMAELNGTEALAESSVIGIVTFGICLAGVHLGRKIGTRLSNKAMLLGGTILILIGLRILLGHLFGIS